MYLIVKFVCAGVNLLCKDTDIINQTRDRSFRPSSRNRSILWC